MTKCLFAEGLKQKTGPLKWATNTSSPTCKRTSSVDLYIGLPAYSCVMTKPFVILPLSLVPPENSVFWLCEVEITTASGKPELGRNRFHRP